MKYFYYTVLLFNWIDILNAQQITFSKVFSNFPLNPENGIIILEYNSGYLNLTFSSCFENPKNDCCALVKLNQSGSIEWFKQLPFNQGSNTLVIHNDLIYVAGHTHGPFSQYTLYCVDRFGKVVWNKVYGEATKKSRFPRLGLWSNKWVLCGTQDRNINNRPAPIMYFVVADINGNLLHEFYHGEHNESTLPRKLAINSRGELMASFQYCPDTCFIELKAGVTAFDASGNISWEIDLPFSFDCLGCVPSQINDSTIAISWCVDNLSIPNHDLTPPAIFFADLSGNILDTIVFQNQTRKDIRNMEPIWGRGLIGCGREYPNYLNVSNPRLFGWLFRMDENRKVLWERSYLDSTYLGRSFGLQHVIPTSDGGYIATGTITNFMTGVWESHNWLLKLDSSGCLEPGCGNINYITNTEEAVFLKGKNLKIYPNPANHYVHIEFPPEFDMEEYTYVILLSSTGTIIRQEKVNATKSQLQLAGIAPGVYYIVIRQDNEIIESKRIVVHH